MTDRSQYYGATYDHFRIIRGYYGSDYTIVSQTKLTEGQIHTLRMNGFLGDQGQIFKILSTCDGTEQINPEYTIPCPFGPEYSPLKFYTYRVYSNCDSSD